MIKLMLGGVYAEEMVEQMLKAVYITTTTPSRAWLHGCMFAQPSILRILSSAGCDITKTYVRYQNRACKEGYVSDWNCLFFLARCASWPQSSAEFEALQLLLNAGANIFLRDAKNRTIFGHVDDEMDPELGSYRRDLWYSALQRAHIRVDRPASTLQKAPIYGQRYTPTHYRAICHLESWEKDDIETQVARLPESFPWSQGQKETNAHIAEERSPPVEGK
jgi:hypothetical protein